MPDLSNDEISQIWVRLAQLERKVDFILQHAPDVPPMPAESASLPQECIDRMNAGDMIGAIKAYRAATGADLATAKRAIESGGVLG